MNRIILIVLCSFMSFGIMSFGTISEAKEVKLNIKQKKKLKYWQKQITKFEGRIEKACGTKIPITLDKSGVAEFLEKNTSLSSYCESIAYPVMTFCKDPDVKSTIVEKIKSIKCMRGEPKALTFKMEGTSYIGTFGLGASNINRKAKEWLENNL